MKSFIFWLAGGALVISLLVNALLAAMNWNLQASLEVSSFLSSRPPVEEVLARFGPPVESFPNSHSIKQRGWRLPPWNSSSPVVVFAFGRAQMIFVSFDASQKVFAFWVSSS
jgi:hypothetical protein